MSIKRIFNYLSQHIHDRINSVKTIGHNIVDNLSKDGSLYKRAVESAKDIITGIRDPDAMPAHQRHLDEFKGIVGLVAAVAGTIQLSPLFAGSGAIPAAEAAIDLQQAGHQSRVKHGLIPG